MLKTILCFMFVALLTSLDALAQVEDTRIIVSVDITIARGTRRNNDEGTPSPCDGRSFCVIFGATTGVLRIPTGTSFTPNNATYKAKIGKLANGKFVMRVNKADITPEAFQIVFGDGKFVMDSDYTFANDILQAMQTNSCVLKAGTHQLFTAPNYVEFVF